MEFQGFVPCKSSHISVVERKVALPYLKYKNKWSGNNKTNISVSQQQHASEDENSVCIVYSNYLRGRQEDHGNPSLFMDNLF